MGSLKVPRETAPCRAPAWLVVGLSPSPSDIKDEEDWELAWRKKQLFWFHRLNGSRQSSYDVFGKAINH